MYEPKTDTFPEYDGGGLPLGIMAEEEYHEHVECAVAPGSIILAATDGLWEIMGEGKALYGMNRLRELLRSNSDKSATEISELIRDALARFCGPAAQDNNLTFVIIRME